MIYDIRITINYTNYDNYEYIRFLIIDKLQ